MEKLQLNSTLPDRVPGVGGAADTQIRKVNKNVRANHLKKGNGE